MLLVEIRAVSISTTAGTASAHSETWVMAKSLRTALEQARRNVVVIMSLGDLPVKQH